MGLLKEKMRETQLRSSDWRKKQGLCVQDRVCMGRWGRKREKIMDSKFQIAILSGFYKIPELHV